MKKESGTKPGVYFNPFLEWFLCSLQRDAGVSAQCLSWVAGNTAPQTSCREQWNAFLDIRAQCLIEYSVFLLKQPFFAWCVCVVFFFQSFPFKLPLAINYWPVKWDLGTGWCSDPDLMWPWADGWPFLIWADRPTQNSRVGNAFCKLLTWLKKKNNLIICQMFTVHLQFCSWKARELYKEKNKIFPFSKVWLPEGHAQWFPNCFLWVNWHLSPSPNREKKTQINKILSRINVENHLK